MLPVQIKTLTDLGGIQSGKALTDFSPRDAVIALNGHFDIAGSFNKRKGGEKYNETSLANIVTGLYDFRYNNDQSSIFLVCAGTNIYKGTSGTFSSLYSSQTAGAYYNFATYNDYAHISNGTDNVLKFDGTTVTNQGITKPSTSPSLAGSASGGSLSDGTYNIRVTFINDSDSDNIIESNPCDVASITLSAGGASQSINLTSIPVSSDSQVTKRRVYMDATPDTNLYLNATISDNTTTILTITATDTTGSLLEYDHDPAPTGLEGLTVFKDRMWGFKNNTIYFTSAFKPWYWPQGDLDQDVIYTLNIGNSDPITAIYAFFDILLVFKKYDVFSISGDSPLQFRADRIRSDERRGAVSKRGIAVIDNYCYFIGINSIYRTNGVTIQDVGAPLQDSFSQNADITNLSIDRDYLQNSILLYYEEKSFLLAFVPTGGSTYNNTVFCMNTTSVNVDAATNEITADWVPWTGFKTQSTAIVIESSSENWFRGDDVGYVFRQEQLDGDGSEITSTSTGSNTSTTLNDTVQSWTTNLYAGLRVTITAGTGTGQERVISSNTSTALTISASWDTTPDSTSVYTIGGIDYQYQHSWDHYGNPAISKRWLFAKPRFRTTGSYDVTIRTLYDFSGYDELTYSINVGTVSLWDVALWDVATWDGTFFSKDKHRVHASRIHEWSSYYVANPNAGQPISYDGFDKMFQMKGVR